MCAFRLFDDGGCSEDAYRRAPAITTRVGNIIYLFIYVYYYRRTATAAKEYTYNTTIRREFTFPSFDFCPQKTAAHPLFRGTRAVLCYIPKYLYPVYIKLSNRINLLLYILYYNHGPFDAKRSKDSGGEHNARMLYMRVSCLQKGWAVFFFLSLFIYFWCMFYIFNENSRTIKKKIVKIYCPAVQIRSARVYIILVYHRSFFYIFFSFFRFLFSAVTRKKNIKGDKDKKKKKIQLK